VRADDGDSDPVRTAPGARRQVISFRRSPHLVAFWRGGTLVVSNYATRVSAEVTPLVCQLLDVCSSWTTPEEIGSALEIRQPALVAELVGRLTRLSFLERSDRERDPRVRRMSRLDPWNPEAGFFHTATRDVPFASPGRAARQARLQIAAGGMPPAVKRYSGRKTVRLPKPLGGGEFAAVLKERRTWRRFGSAPLALDDLATVLAYTVGIQLWAHVGALRVPLKTSPSGGGRHPIECYVVARGVKGLKAGVYHYAADRHTLERIRGPVPLARMRAYVPNSGYFAKASAMVFFTAVFERIMWRYPYSRAYRAALVEAGHVCQTFCLTATWRGLAPYCVMGLADSLIEKDLGIDGISESVLYAAGVGRPPRGVGWAPLPTGGLKVRKNRHVNP
jgi:SagB-type dehydrogenase family enzyme